MPELAIDRFRDRGLPSELEARAQRRAAEIGRMTEPAAMLGYLRASIAIDLENPRWKSRDGLRVDLRVIDILWDRRR